MHSHSPSNVRLRPRRHPPLRFPRTASQLHCLPLAQPRCTGVVRDNGIYCSGVRKAFELRGGGTEPSRRTNAWVCGKRLAETEIAEKAALPPNSGANMEEGFLFIVHGGCARPGYNCTHVLELREAVGSLRAIPIGGRPIAVLSDGAIPASFLTSELGINYVCPLNRQRGGARDSLQEDPSPIDDDPRVKKVSFSGLPLCACS